VNLTISLATVITVTDIQPNTMQRGDTISVAISGSGFTSGAKVTFENGESPTPTASVFEVAPEGDSLTATITVKKGGPPRPRDWDVRVTNPDGSSGVLVAGFTVTP
jgi:hypothetical protein